MCTLLVNPRQNNEEYTKFSFPSKIMEYLQSGKPVVAYKLDGIPDEYDDYIFYVKDNDPHSLAQEITRVASMSKDQRDAVGKRARYFVQTKKNNVIQSQKILEILNYKKN